MKKQFKSITAMTLAAAMTITAGSAAYADEYKAFRPVDGDMGICVFDADPVGSVADDIVRDYFMIYPDRDRAFLRDDNAYDLYRSGKLGIAMSKTSDNGTSILWTTEGASVLGQSHGGLGVTSAAAADLNGDGWAEFYFTYSWNGGTYCSQIGYFDTNTEEVVYFDKLMCPDAELMLADEDGVLTLYTAEIADKTDKVHFTLTPKEKAGEIACVDGNIAIAAVDGMLTEAEESLAPPPAWEMPDWVPKSYDEVEELMSDDPLKEDCVTVKDNLICYVGYIGGAMANLGEISAGIRTDETSSVKAPVSHMVYMTPYLTEAHVVCYEMPPSSYLAIANTELTRSEPVAYFVSDAEGNVTQTEKGDANGDGKVNIADLVTLSNWILGKANEPDHWHLADMCNDSSLNAYDTVLIRRAVVNSK